MCRKTLWSPAGPCCGDSTVCKSLPRIDWNKYTWMVEHPAAETGQAVVPDEWRTGEIVFPALWDTATNAIQGWVVPENEPFLPTDYFGLGPDVIFGNRYYSYRAGRYLSEHAGSCVWRIYNREELWPANHGILWADKQILGAPNNLGRWNIGAVHIVPLSVRQSWADYTGQEPEYTAMSWQDILRFAECSFLPTLLARSDVYSVGGDVLDRLFEFEELAESGRLGEYPGSRWLYQPTAIQVAASYWLSPGFLFGFVPDPNSPLYGQFTIFEGGTYDDDVLTESAWSLVNGPITDELGITWTFQRTAAIPWLPATVTLKLVRK